MSEKKRILVTSALPYANGPIHLGHLAGAYLPADIFVRYHRLKGHDIIHICGSDEHGVAILLRARKEDVSPKEIIDHYHEMIKSSFATFGIDFDFYGRTSSQIHHETSQNFFRTLDKKGVFKLKKDRQLYDPEAQMFLADRYVRGTCPKCNYADAYGDQCERCGSSLTPLELIDPRSAVTNAKPILMETTHWYIPLADYQKKLENWINSRHDWKPNVLGQIRSWFADGLKDRPVTRDLPWGVAVPKDVADSAHVDVSGKVLYVWFDAPIGYISATREWAAQSGNPKAWEKYWKDPDTRLVHFIGKDNIVFHCIIFPAMLIAHGEYILPESVPANEFLNLEGNKFSTSRNYAVWLDEYLKSFEPDSLRYSLAASLPENRDSDFSWSEFQTRYNNELADILGNFVNRTVTFAIKNFSGKVPLLSAPDKLDQELINHLKEVPEKTGRFIDSFQFKNAVREMMDLARFANKYFNDQKPWETIKKDPQKCANTIHLCLETIKTLSIIFQPVLPETSKKIHTILNLPKSVTANQWDRCGEISLPANHELGQPEILFVKIEDTAIENEQQKLRDALRGNELQENSESETVTYEEFAKLDFRVAEILLAERIPKADRLLKLQIQIGKEERQIVAGIAEHYKPEELIGKKIIVVANLKPATIRGETSNGMLLAARDGNTLTLITPDGIIESGAKIS